MKLGLAGELIVQNIKHLCRQSLDIKRHEECAFGSSGVVIVLDICKRLRVEV